MAGTTAVKVRTRLIGQTQYAQHNVQLADPDNYWAREIAKITGKRKKTEEDRQNIQRLEFLGGLYIHQDRIVVPKMNVRRCFQEAAKATRKGKDIVRAVNIADAAEPNASLVFPDDDKAPEELYGLGKYKDVTIVAVRGRTPRCRPAFSTWGLTVDWLLLTNLLDFDEFEEIVHTAGVVEGLGDNRVNGWGRFNAEVMKI
jgi:hypothetical protein